MMEVASTRCAVHPDAAEPAAPHRAGTVRSARRAARHGRRTIGAIVTTALLLLGAAAPIALDRPALAQDAAGEAKSVIFFLGDGMGQAHRDAAQFYTVGPYGNLVMDSLPVSGMVGTNPADPEALVTDSAAGGSALATGVKTYNGAINVDPNGRPATSIAELAKAAGKAVGVVTTSQVTDASPAAFGGAHVADRGDQSEIARQLIEDVQVDVILGGGEDRWLPPGEAGAYPDNPPTDPEEQSAGDQGNLIQRAQELGYEYVSDAAGLEAATGPKLLGLFANEEMFEQRPEGQGDLYEPVVTLEQMTAKAIELLAQDPDGFFLFVEEEAIDEMPHNNNGLLTLKAMQELDKAVARGVEYATANPDTLLIVGADHESGSLVIEGLDDPEQLDESGAGGTYGGAGAAAGTPAAMVDMEGISGEDGPFPVAGTDYQFVLDWTTTDHTPVSVPLTAMGPGSERLAGVYENTHVFVAVVEAMGLELPAGVPATPMPGATPVA